MNGIEWNCRTLHDGLELARLGTRDVDATGVLAMMQLAVLNLKILLARTIILTSSNHFANNVWEHYMAIIIGWPSMHVKTPKRTKLRADIPEVCEQTKSE